MDDSFSDTLLLQHLEEVALRLAIDVRYENLGDDEICIHSGGCKVSGHNLILIDSSLTPLERARVLARELSGYDLESMYLLPRVRDFILLHGSFREKNRPHK